MLSITIIIRNRIKYSYHIVLNIILSLHMKQNRNLVCFLAEKVGEAIPCDGAF